MCSIPFSLPHRWRFLMRMLLVTFQTMNSIRRVPASSALTKSCTEAIMRIWSSCKQSLVIHSDQATYTILIDNWGVLFGNQAFRIFHNGWIDCRCAFHVDIQLQRCRVGWDQWLWSVLPNGWLIILRGQRKFLITILSFEAISTSF